ncbi:hypothetical protein ACFL3H_03635, partial [Gemmatimonadota bacterium]
SEADRRLRAALIDSIREHEAGADAKIIALTAHALEEERIEILESGCDDLIRKPYRNTDIYQALVKHLGIRFLFAEKQAPGPAFGAVELTAERMARVPAHLIEHLRESVVLLDRGECLWAAGMISDHDPELGDTLRLMVENLQFNTILKSLDRIPVRVPE